MPFELSVNLEYGFTEAGEKIEDRIAAAAAAGFRKVELFLLKGRDLAAIRRRWMRMAWRWSARWRTMRRS